MAEKFVPVHFHLLVKGYLSNPPRDEASLNKFFIELVSTVRMKVIGGPTSVYVDEPGNEGVTGTVTLATSHSSMHVWDQEQPAMFQFDLYSCSKFTVDEVINHINKSFGLISYTFWMIDRNGNEFKKV